MFNSSIGTSDFSMNRGRFQSELFSLKSNALLMFVALYDSLICNQTTITKKINVSKMQFLIILNANKLY